MRTSNSLLGLFSLSKSKVAKNYPIGRRWFSSTIAADKIIHPCTTLPSRVSPWLMLGGPDHDHRTMYNFFSFKENKTIRLPKSFTGPGGESEPDPFYVGSSHGWLAWVSGHPNRDIYLTNPVSNRQILLPSVFPLLGIDGIPSYHNASIVESIFLTSSPDSDQNSIAVMIYDQANYPSHRVAFCGPGRDSEWTQFNYDLGPDEIISPEMVYSGKDHSFYYLQEDHIFGKLDLRDRLAHLCKKVPSSNLEWGDFQEVWDVSWISVTHPVIEHLSGDILFVKRYDDRDKRTVDFRAFVFNREMDYCTDTLPDNCVVFVGKNHGFALKASDFPEFVPNSIYFTDCKGYYYCKTYCVNGQIHTYVSGSYDIGIFDYKNKSISPCCGYPLEKCAKIEPAPIWFTPNPH